MTIEDQLKNLILSRYRSIREFTIEIDMPYTTIDSIFKRKIANSSVSNVIKICKALGISADELADGRIVPISEVISLRENYREIGEQLQHFKNELSQMENLTIDGDPIDDEALEVLSHGIDVSYETVKRYNKNHNKNHNKTYNTN